MLVSRPPLKPTSSSASSSTSFSSSLVKIKLPHKKRGCSTRTKQEGRWFTTPGPRYNKDGRRTTQGSSYPYPSGDNRVPFSMRDQEEDDEVEVEWNRNGGRGLKREDDGSEGAGLAGNLGRRDGDEDVLRYPVHGYRVADDRELALEREAVSQRLSLALQQRRGSKREDESRAFSGRQVDNLSTISDASLDDSDTEHESQAPRSNNFERHEGKQPFKERLEAETRSARASPSSDPGTSSSSRSPTEGQYLSSLRDFSDDHFTHMNDHIFHASLPIGFPSPFAIFIPTQFPTNALHSLQAWNHQPTGFNGLTHMMYQEPCADDYPFQPHWGHRTAGIPSEMRDYQHPSLGTAHHRNMLNNPLLNSMDPYTEHPEEDLLREIQTVRELQLPLSAFLEDEAYYFGGGQGEVGILAVEEFPGLQARDRELTEALQTGISDGVDFERLRMRHLRLDEDGEQGFGEQFPPWESCRGLRGERGRRSMSNFEEHGTQHRHGIFDLEEDGEDQPRGRPSTSTSQQRHCHHCRFPSPPSPSAIENTSGELELQQQTQNSPSTTPHSPPSPLRFHQH